ncbi:MAG: winged helix-turn-helix transcriptional regulator [Thermoplasmatota archaeon]
MAASVQERILACIRTYPGIHLRGIERALSLSSALVHYHVRELERKGDIASETAHGYTRYYDREATVGPAKIRKEDRATLAILREETPAQIIVILLDEGALPHHALVQRTGLSKSTVTYQLDKLAEEGLVEKVQGAGQWTYRVREEERLRRLLLAYRPAPDLFERFQRLWSDFYKI